MGLIIPRDLPRLDIDVDRRVNVIGKTGGRLKVVRFVKAFRKDETE